MTKIIFHGDSITDCGRAQGLGDAGFQDHKLGPGYPAMVAADLLCGHPGTEWSFLNWGMSGSSIPGLASKWVGTLAEKPDIVSMLIGVNDAHTDVALADYPFPLSYEEIYRMLLKSGRDGNPALRYVLIEPFMLEDSEKPSPRAEKVAEKAASVRRLAEEFNAVFVPMQEIFNAASRNVPKSHWSSDTVHLTLAGHKLLADSWLDYYFRTYSAS